MKTKESKGFTLTEMMVTLAIVALLTSLAIPGLAAMRQNAEDIKTEEDLRQIYNGIIMFEAANGRTPTSWVELQGYISVPNAETKYELNTN